MASYPTSPRLRLAGRLRLWQTVTPMRLITAHKILIGSAVAFFAFFAAFELRAFASSGRVGALASAVLGLAAAVGFGLYLRSVFARNRQPPG